MLNSATNEGTAGVRAEWGFLLLGALFAAGCGGAPGDQQADQAPTDVSSTAQALHSGGGSLPWRGGPPDPIPMTTRRFGVNSVIWRVDIGVTKKKIVGLQVCSYSPTNPNNFYTNGDQSGCTIIGQGTAGSWTTQNCPDGYVVSGYHIATTGSLNAGITNVSNLGMLCTSLTNRNNTASLPGVGDGSLFGEPLVCPGYIDSIQMNRSGSGMGAACDLP